MGSIGHRYCKRIMKEKTPLLHYFLCIQMIKGLSENLPLSQKLRYFRDLKI